jgi:hypothetical protein
MVSVICTLDLQALGLNSVKVRACYHAQPEIFTSAQDKGIEGANPVGSISTKVSKRDKAVSCLPSQAIQENVDLTFRRHLGQCLSL